jgi:threonine synthase
VPVGNGSLLLGLARGLAPHGDSDGGRPGGVELVGVQAAGCAPLAAPFLAGSNEPSRVARPDTVAEGIAIGVPARGREILSTLRTGGGRMVIVDDDEILAAQALLAAAGIRAELTGAVALAGHLHARSPAADPTVVIVTGIDRY